MSTTTTASAGAAEGTPSTVTAPASSVGETAAQSPALTPTNAKSALDFISTPGDALAARYGFTEPDELPGDAPTEPTPEPAAEPTAGEPAPTEPAAQTPKEPAPSAEPFTPITPFTLHDDQGEFEIPANVKVTFNAGGKEYKGLRIDEVVRMAQQAPNVEHQRTMEREQYQTNLTQREQAVQQLAQELQRNNALYEELLSNPALYQEAAGRYQAINTPEQRLARLEQQRQIEAQQYQQTIQQTQLQQTMTAAANYTASRIAPSVESLIQQHPAVEAGDVMAKFHELTAPLLAASPNGGVWVPPNRLPELESTVLPQLVAWTQARAAKATAASTAAAAQAKAQVQKAQMDAQLAKRHLARPLTPAGTAPMPDTPRPKPIKTTGDAIDSILGKVSQQIRGAA